MEPCIMLMTFNTPHTSEKPTARHAYSPPISNPFITYCPNMMPASGDDRVLLLGNADPQVALLQLFRRENQQLVVLNLHDQRGICVVLAGLAVVDGPVERIEGLLVKNL